MAVETPSLFGNVIQEHLELKRRNAELEREMPLNRYKGGDPFENHPLFKTEEQARIEDTLGGDVAAPELPEEPAWPGEETAEHSVGRLEESLWSRSRDFDWGD